MSGRPRSAQDARKPAIDAQRDPAAGGSSTGAHSFRQLGRRALIFVFPALMGLVYLAAFHDAGGALGLFFGMLIFEGLVWAIIKLMLMPLKLYRQSQQDDFRADSTDPASVYAEPDGANPARVDTK